MGPSNDHLFFVAEFRLIRSKKKPEKIPCRLKHFQKQHLNFLQRNKFSSIKWELGTFYVKSVNRILDIINHFWPFFMQCKVGGKDNEKLSVQDQYWSLLPNVHSNSFCLFFFVEVATISCVLQLCQIFLLVSPWCVIFFSQKESESYFKVT